MKKKTQRKPHANSFYNYRKSEPKKAEPEPEPTVESDPESDVDIDNEGCVEPDNDPPQVKLPLNLVETLFQITCPAMLTSQNDKSSFVNSNTAHG